MKKFKDYMKEQMLVQVPGDPRGLIVQAFNMISNMEQPAITDSQDLIIKLRDLLDDVLSGRK